MCVRGPPSERRATSGGGEDADKGDPWCTAGGHAQAATVETMTAAPRVITPGTMMASSDPTTGLTAKARESLPQRDACTPAFTTAKARK